MTAPKIDTQAPERIWTYEGPDGVDWTEVPTQFWPEYILASLSAAREAAAAMAMREAAAKEIDCEGCGGKCYDPANCWQSAAADIRALPVPDTAALDRLITERVREARNTAWDEAADIMDGYGQHGYAEEFRVRICAARGSKEDRDG